MSDLRRAQTSEIAKRYLHDLHDLLAALDLQALEDAVERLRAARDDGRTVFIAGNGGSAATATHLANDLGKAAKRSGALPFRVMCLSDNVSWLTALANDEGYARSFAGQLENFLEAGDVLILISASGSSPNLVEAQRVARAGNATTLGILGFDGGVLKDQVDELLWLPTEQGAYGLVESAHSVVCDLLTSSLMVDGPQHGPTPAAP